MTATATLRDEVRHSPAGMRQFLRGHLSDGQVQLVSGPDSHLIVGFARANCLVVVDEQAVSLPAGAQVPIIVLNG
jgi:molybdopterin molybdotransferase